MKALDLFCGAGGATKGLQQAGFHVTGIDNRPQPRYCGDAFIRADALNPPVDLAEFDFIWASPPCQLFTNGATARMAKGAKYINLIPETRALLAEHPITVIENVMGAPLRADLILHGHMFDLKVIRRRQFELSWNQCFLVPPLPRGLLRDGFVCVAGVGTPSGVIAIRSEGDSLAKRRAAMGIDWMDAYRLSQAIPPAYAEFIGREAIQQIQTK